MGALSIFPGRLCLMNRNYQRVFALEAEEMVILFEKTFENYKEYVIVYLPSFLLFSCM